MTLEHTNAFLDLVRRLTAVLERETAAVHGMALRNLDAIQAEKSGLVEAYEREVRRLRQAPTAKLPPEAIGPLRTLDARIRQNALTLAAARNVVEGVVRRLSEAAHATPYGGQAGGTAPVTLNEHI